MAARFCKTLVSARAEGNEPELSLTTVVVAGVEGFSQFSPSLSDWRSKLNYYFCWFTLIRLPCILQDRNIWFYLGGGSGGEVHWTIIIIIVIITEVVLQESCHALLISPQTKTHETEPVEHRPPPPTPAPASNHHMQQSRVVLLYCSVVDEFCQPTSSWSGSSRRENENFSPNWGNRSLKKRVKNKHCFHWTEMVVNKDCRLWRLSGGMLECSHG